MEKRDFVEMLWKYFELHSSQRMQMMNFYIILESLFSQVCLLYLQLTRR